MQPATDNKIVLVTRPTRLAELVARFNTVSQARFYVEHLGADFSDYLAEDNRYGQALVQARTTLGALGRVQICERRFLPNFVFAPSDIVVTLGQDGLVANTLKYLDGQPVIGVNPDPQRWDGQLLPFKLEDLAGIIPEVLARRRPVKQVTMAQATLNSGQIMFAVNDLFIGPKSHGSARYSIQLGDRSEHQLSSGVIVSTGLGSTGWLKSLLTGAAAIAQSAGDLLGSGDPGKSRPAKPVRRTGPPPLPVQIPWNAEYLCFTVREPFPTASTSASLVFGRVTPARPLVLRSQTAENGVIFSDGMEWDFLEFNSGTEAVIAPARRTGTLVV